MGTTVGDCVISQRSVRYLSEFGVGMDVLYRDSRAREWITAPVPPASFPFSMKTENKEAATIIILKSMEGQTI